VLTPFLIELASWTIVSEIVRRVPKLLRVIETHPGGGQYDCLSIIRADNRSHLCALNRLGSFTAFHWFDTGHDCWAQMDVWTRISRGDSTKNIIAEICHAIRVPTPQKLPPGTTPSLTYRIMTAMLQTKMFSPVRWSVRNGFHDSSGFCECGIRKGLFSKFQGLNTPGESEKAGSSRLARGYDFWFLCRDDEPVVCFDVTGLTFFIRSAPIGKRHFQLAP